MYLTRQKVALTTASDGSATGYTDHVNGLIRQIRYVKTDFAAGVDFAVTLETSGVAVWTGTDVNASATIIPTQATHGATGTAATYDGTNPVLAPIAVTDERIKVVVANGGPTATGTLYIWVG